MTGARGLAIKAPPALGNRRIVCDPRRADMNVILNQYALIKAFRELTGVPMASNHGFSPVELNTIGRLLRDNRNQILEAWDEHCGTRR